MPELPEVQTVVADLQELIVGRKLDNIDILDRKVWQGSGLEAAAFSGLIIRSVDRRGKYIVYNFGDKFLVQHLRMTGKMLPSDSDKIPHNIITTKSPQIRLAMNFSGLKLLFYDTRRFGTVAALSDLNGYFVGKSIAPEIYSPNGYSVALAHYLSKVGGLRRCIKTVILDQTIICGAGNIYADEALHRAGVHPEVPTCELTLDQHEAIFAYLKQVMDEAIAKRGTTASDYLDVNGNPGVFKQYLNVYGREGEQCKTCRQHPVTRIKIAGRSSHFCLNCQPC